MFFLFTIKTFAFCSLFFLFIESDWSILLNILVVNIHELFCRNKIFWEISSLSCKICESRNQISSRLNDISKVYVFIDLLTQCDKFRQSIQKIIIYKLNLNFIWYFLSESINFCNLVSFKLFNKIQKFRKEASKFEILLSEFFQFCNNIVLAACIIICLFQKQDEQIKSAECVISKKWVHCISCVIF